MNILIISFYNPLDNAPRPAQLLGIVDLLIKNNHTIDLITTTSNISIKDHFRFHLYNLDKIKYFEIKQNTYLKIITCKIINQLHLDKGACFSFFAFFKAISLNKKYDRAICITNPFTTAYIGFLLKKVGVVKKLHVDAGDPFIKHRRHRSEKFSTLRKHIERVVCNNVDDFVLPVIESLQDFEYLKQNYRIIPQIFCSKEISSDYNLPKGKINLFYCGRFYDGFREPYSLFLAIDKLISEGHPLHFHYFGIDGLSENHSKFFFKLNNLTKNSTLNDALDRESLLFIMKKMNILINILNKGLHQTPSKIIDYNISGSYIINIGEVGTVSNIYDVICPNNVDAIKEAIKYAIQSKKYLQKTTFSSSRQNLRDYISLIE